MTSNPNEPDGIDTSGSTVPPYEGRRTTADMEDKDEAYRDGVNLGGATGPVENNESATPDPRDTPGGATGSPADEQPASRAAETDLDDDRVGPAHQAGAPRAEDQHG
jgi:hypothetical protein